MSLISVHPHCFSQAELVILKLPEKPNGDKSFTFNLSYDTNIIYPDHTQTLSILRKKFFQKLCWRGCEIECKIILSFHDMTNRFGHIKPASFVYYPLWRAALISKENRFTVSGFMSFVFVTNSFAPRSFTTQTIDCKIILLWKVKWQNI